MELDAMVLRFVERVIWLAALGGAVYGVVHYIRYTLPQQLIQLVKQAHHGHGYPTAWNIGMSDEMRLALCAPLTRQQLLEMWRDPADVTSRSVNGYVLSHRYRWNELSGVVCLSVETVSRSGGCNVSVSGMKLRITVQRTPESGRRWMVTEVERLP